MKVKALTICQPYASLIINPPHEKRVENRSWPTSYRGPLVIHAGKSRKFLDGYSGRMPNPMPFGVAVGIADIFTCASREEIMEMATDHPLAWLKSHEHTEGPYCFVLDQIHRFENPVPMLGCMGLFNVDVSMFSGVDAAEITNRVRAAELVGCQQ